MNFPKHNISKNTLFIVADGERAAMFESTNDHDIKLKSLGDMDFENMGDKGPGILPPEMSDREKGEATVAKHIADGLYEKVHSKGVERFVLVADPDTLGEIRPSLHDSVKGKIILEIPKTLTNSPINDIEKVIKAEMAA